jgi:hypothetical protein
LQLVLRRFAREVEQALPEPELLRDCGATLARDDVRTNLGETALRGIGEAVEDRPRDRELEDAVAQELEPLVRRRPVVGPRGVRENLLEPVCRQLCDQAAELGRPDVGLDVSPDAR